MNTEEDYRLLKEMCDDLHMTFELRHKADMRAIERWCAEHPGKELVMPDHADLVVWLIGRISELEQQLAQAQAACAQLSVRITDYLSCGGLFNPEAMEHDKVRDLLIDCRDNFNGRKQEGWLSPDEAKRIENCIAICEAKNEELGAKLERYEKVLKEYATRVTGRWGRIAREALKGGE